MNSQDIRYALEDTDIFLSDISGASDDSDKDKTYNPPDSGKQKSDTDIFFIFFYEFSFKIASVTLPTN